ncbi:hypothetical protein WJX75_006315 [Coccomyxa subellipsoidea]|uniref:Uncharacterized protein n=1 Tax=Coccomyxa subellipsoidea TaxID=248742 RepID=A0ABR2YY93_9CHLO
MQDESAVTRTSLLYLHVEKAKYKARLRSTFSPAGQAAEQQLAQMVSCFSQRHDTIDGLIYTIHQGRE